MWIVLGAVGLVDAGVKAICFAVVGETFPETTFIFPLDGSLKVFEG